MSTFPTLNRSSGFTLVELLVVLAIISILAVVAIPALGTSHPGIDRRQILAKLETAIDSSRNDAMTQGKVVSVDFASIDKRLRFTPLEPAQDQILVFYPDGSAVGGKILLAERPLLSIDWLTGASDEVG